MDGKWSKGCQDRHTDSFAQHEDMKRAFMEALREFHSSTPAVTLSGQPPADASTKLPPSPPNGRAGGNPPGLSHPRQALQLAHWRLADDASECDDEEVDEAVEHDREAAKQSSSTRQNTQQQQQSSNRR